MKYIPLAIVLCLSWIQPVSAANFATTVMDATFKLFHTDSTSTCLLVRGPEPTAAYFLVTTAHSFERMKGETAILVLRRQNDQGTFERVDHSIPIRKGEQVLWHRHKEQDVAVLHLTGELPTNVAAIPIDSLADAEKLTKQNVHICSPLFAFSYPERFEANGAGFPIARQGIFSSPPQLPIDTHPTFLADFTTFPGDSGGPVFIATANDAPLIVGIVVGQHLHNEKIESTYETRLVKHPFRLGIVLHSRYIQETLNSVPEWESVRPNK